MPGPDSKPTRGYIIVTEGELKGSPDGRVDFMFNPTEYTVSKKASWNTPANKGSNVPKYEFQGGEPRELSLELFFDSYLPRDDGVQEKDVRRATNKLFNFMMIDKGPQKRGQNSKMGEPPKCRLMWGQDSTNHFEGYITSCQVKYLLFNEDGIPVRATATLSIKEAVDKEDRLPTNPTSSGEPGRRTWVVQLGDRLDWIAYQEYGDAREWRRIAEANHLYNPLDLRPGMVLAIPPL